MLLVLFVADARVTFDNFRKSMVATIISKTIITVNPGKILIGLIGFDHNPNLCLSLTNSDLEPEMS